MPLRNLGVYPIGIKWVAAGLHCCATLDVYVNTKDSLPEDAPWKYYCIWHNPLPKRNQIPAATEYW